MPDDGLARLRAAFPAEIAAAERLADEQAAAIAASPSPRLHAGVDRAARAAADGTAARWMPGQASGDGGDALHYWSIRRINEAFATGTCDPPTLLDALFARIEALDGRLNSVVALDRAGAAAAAGASAERWAAGAARGPLDGVPVGIKDVIDVAGLPTRCQSRVTSAAPARHDAAVVARLRQAGAVIVGKLATHEFAIGGPAFDLPFPPARNPWDLGRHPGGSSSGAGAAVAAGLVPLAVGTDTAGSVRNPASACGIVGLKPGRGVLPVAGVVPLAPTLDHVGLLTRDVGDMAIAAAALGIDVASGAPGRIGYVRHFHMDDMPATAEIAAVLDRVAAALGAAEVALPPLGRFALVNRIVLQAEGYAAHGAHLRERPEALSHLTRAALLPGAFISPATLAAARAEGEVLTREVDAAFESVDLLLTASSMEPPCRIDDHAEIARSYLRQARTPFNVTGHPALTMAAGLSTEGLPLSIQFAARRGEEGRLLAAAAAWEAMRGPLPLPPIG